MPEFAFIPTTDQQLLCFGCQVLVKVLRYKIRLVPGSQFGYKGTQVKKVTLFKPGSEGTPSFFDPLSQAFKEAVQRLDSSRQQVGSSILDAFFFRAEQFLKK